MLALAWRNLLRARGRTLTTLVVVALVVFLSLVLLCFSAASFDGFVRVLTERSAHVVVRVEGYREKQDLESLSFEADAVKRRLPLPPGAAVEGLLEAPVLVVAGDRSRVVALVGLEPAGLARQSRHLVRGRLPTAPAEALLGVALARALRVQPGADVVGYAPGGLGRAVYPFRVVGLLDLPETHLEARTLVVPLAAAQELVAPGRVTRLEVRLPLHAWYEERAVQALAADLRARLPGYAVETWREAHPAMDAMLRLYDPILAVYVGIFFVLVGLLLLNAVYLGVVERVREFGLLAALGASRSRVMALVLLESSLVVACGLVVGLAGGLAASWLMSDGFRLPGELAEQYREFGLPEVLYGRLAPKDYLLALGYAAAIAVLAAAWPGYVAGRLEPVEAMRYTP